MSDDIRAQLASRVKDPADVPKFERLFRLVDRRLTKLGTAADLAKTTSVTMQAWREVFGVEWPETKKPERRLARAA